MRILGKKGELTGLLRGMGKLSPEERPAMGQLVNSVREKIETALDEQAARIADAEKQARLKEEAIDVTLPGKTRQMGALHPISQAENALLDIFTGMGFEVVQGPEIELDHYNFELMNLPKEPSRARRAGYILYIR